MYERHFELSGCPFRLTPDRRFYFESEAQRKAMSYLKYGLHQGEGFIVITGDVGTGKSTLVEQIFSELDLNEVVAAKINTTQIDPENAIRLIVNSFDIETDANDKATLLNAFEEFLVEQHGVGRHVLLIVDEVQNLPIKTLEELRMLSNFNIVGRPLFQCFLIGQPQFLTTLDHPDLRQLHQRVIAFYKLEPLSREETSNYIIHRLQTVGWKGVPEWTEESTNIIYEETFGVPRRVNTLCNRLMLFASLEGIDTIKAENVHSVLADMRKELEKPLAAPAKQVGSTNSKPALRAENGELEDGRQPAVQAESSSESGLQSDTHVSADTDNAFTSDTEQADPTASADGSADDGVAPHLEQTQRRITSAELAARDDIIRDIAARVGRIEAKLIEHENALNELIDVAVTVLTNGNNDSGSGPDGEGDYLESSTARSA